MTTLRQVDPATHFVPNRVYLMVGKRNSGKTILCCDILYHLRDKIDMLICFSPSDATRKHLQKSNCKAFFYTEFNATVVQALYEKQKVKIREGKRRRICFLFDDCVADPTFIKSPVIKDICYNGRDKEVTVIMTSQYFMDMQCGVRSQIDLIFALREPSSDNRYKLYKYVFGIFDDLRSFNRTFQRYTENFGCLVSDNVSRSNRIVDCAFTYVADPKLPEFSIGRRCFYRWTRRYAIRDAPEKPSENEAISYERR